MFFHGSAFNLQNNFPSGRDQIPLRQSDSVLHVSFKSWCLVPSLPKSNSHQFVYNSDLRFFSAAVTVVWAFVIASLIFGWVVEDVVDGWEDTPDKAWLLNIRSGGGLGG